MDERLKIYGQIKDVFSRYGEVGRVELRGSLLQASFDRFADIDIGIDVSGHDNVAFMWKIIEVMKRHFDVHFHDWAGSLLPGQLVVSFYIKNLPIYWNIDVDCTATLHTDSLQREAIDNDEVAHRLKPWAITCKYLMRGTVGAEHVRGLAGRVLPERPLEGLSVLDLMREMLDELERQAVGRYAGFFAECRATYKKDLLPLDLP